MNSANRQPSKGDAVSPDTHQIADMVIALQRLRGDRQLLIDMAEYFQEDSPALLQTIRNSIDSGNLAESQRAAHSLKGLAATFDADRVISAARELEYASRDGKSNRLPTLFAELEAATDELSSFLTTLTVDIDES